MRKWAMVVAVAVAVALMADAPAAAQEGHGQHAVPTMQEGGMQHCMAMMGGPHPQMLLHHAEELALTADQVSRLEALRDEAKQAAGAHMQPAMQAHMAAAKLLEGDAPDFAGYEARLGEAASHMVKAHVAVARVAVQAAALLTAEQRSELGGLGSGNGMMGGQMGGMMGGHGAGAGGGHRMGAAEGGAGAHDMGEMMMGCMMMGMGAGGEGAHRH